MIINFDVEHVSLLLAVELVQSAGPSQPPQNVGNALASGTTFIVFIMISSSINSFIK